MQQLIVCICRKINAEIRTISRIYGPQAILKVRTSSLGKDYLVLFRNIAKKLKGNNGNAKSSAQPMKFLECLTLQNQFKTKLHKQNIFCNSILYEMGSFPQHYTMQKRLFPKHRTGEPTIENLIIPILPRIIVYLIRDKIICNSA